VLNVLFVVLGYRQLLVSTFDPAFAAASGISVVLWNYLLMGAVSFTTVAAFNSVGAILVVALLVVPPATAYLLTHSLKRMLGLTVLFAFLSSACGYALAVALDGSIAGAIVTCAGGLFVLVWVAQLLLRRKPAKELHSLT
jgi:manganese/zinc/iron transport system permease protein